MYRSHGDECVIRANLKRQRVVGLSIFEVPAILATNGVLCRLWRFAAVVLATLRAKFTSILRTILISGENRQQVAKGLDRMGNEEHAALRVAVRDLCNFS